MNRLLESRYIVIATEPMLLGVLELNTDAGYTYIAINEKVGGDLMKNLELFLTRDDPRKQARDA